MEASLKIKSVKGINQVTNIMMGHVVACVVIEINCYVTYTGTLYCNI